MWWSSNSEATIRPIFDTLSGLKRGGPNDGCIFESPVFNNISYDSLIVEELHGHDTARVHDLPGERRYHVFVCNINFLERESRD